MADGSREDGEETLDAFHRGAFHLLQPARRGHRAGVDAMLLAALVPEGAEGRLADLGSGAGAAGLAVAARVPGVSVVLVERSADMAQFARRSLALPENAAIAPRVEVVEADVTKRAAERARAGLVDETFAHIIMNPPFNAAADRQTPDPLKAEAHAMTGDLFEGWIRTARALAAPGAQLSLIARPSSIAEIVAACRNRFGGIEITPVHPRADAAAIRILLTAIRDSRAGLAFAPPLVLHEGAGHAFAEKADALNNGRAFLARLDRT